MDRRLVLWRIAVRNVLLHKAKSLIVGSVVLFGTALVVLGTALLDAVDAGMRRSITQSLAGDLQIYADDARDDLALFGDTFMAVPDLGLMPNFHEVAATVRQVPNVAAVIPMGVNGAVMHAGNVLDRRLAALRAAVRAHDVDRVTRHKAHVRQTVGFLADDLRTANGLVADDSDLRRGAAAVDRAMSDEFWRAFEIQPLESLEFLENQVAPLQLDGRLFWLRFVGTDVQAFTHWFDRFELVRGELIPPGERGFLINDGYFERFIKHRVARDLDRIHRERQENGSRLADDAGLQSARDQMVKQYRRIIYQLDPEGSEIVQTGLQRLLNRPDLGLAELLQAFLQVDDLNFDARRDHFYAHIAPHIDLYGVRVGDTMTIKGFTRRGYLKSANVKVYGTFRFKGLEKSVLSGIYSLVDLTTFRDLYGLMTPEHAQEIASLRADVQAVDLGRDEAEATLFGEGGSTHGEDAVEVLVAAPPGTFGRFDEFAVSPEAPPKIQPDTPADLEKGVVFNAAIMLDDPDLLEESRAAVEASLKRAGHSVQVVTWQAAAGLVGQLVLVMRVILYFAVFVVFAVALVIVNNSMVMATIERTREIGTMRAIGAQRGFVMRLFLAETTVLNVMAGAAGAGLGAGIVLWLGQVGVPAENAYMHFLFSGPALHPVLLGSHLIIAFVVVFIVGSLSTFYPAALAARIPPATAMAAQEG